ncbi:MULTISPECIES: phosphotransferase family protein [Sphingopyxis]|uniref:Aminoglycoside phosphotransferase domain-containing protein n=1 Tax=Sphingopyxis lindanitolerans TaxID=2054227 RepID=A0A2S8B826_9SPHN|nr:phosphotransferase family protein [Sphingopyxis lindanitolerans]PQM28507.1 hypothetical protein CVO77_08570 [Sphingopyxis lindanitolerans]
MSAETEELQGFYDKSVAAAKSGYPEIDADRLAAFIAAQPGIEGPVTLSNFIVPQSSGASNGILLFTAEFGRSGERRREDMVARYAPGTTMIKQKSFSDEFLTLVAAYKRGLPVPEPLWLDADGSAVGYPSFVMARIEGTPPASAMYSKGPLADVSPEARKAMMLEAAGFHGRLRREAIGREELPHLLARGSGETDIERELNWFLAEAKLSSEPDDPKLDPIVEAHRWMVAHQPAVREGTLVQGDSQIANVMFRDGRLAAVLDWELAYLGHNEADLALIVFLTETMKQLDKHVDGTPTEAEYLARFEEEAGAPAEHYDFFKLFPLFKTQCILLSGRSFQPAFEQVWTYYLAHLHAELANAKRIYGD